MTLIDRWSRLRGLTPPSLDSPPAVKRDWDFEPSRIGYYTHYLRVAAILRRRDFPASTVITTPYPADRWCLYFIYLPHSTLSAAHRYTMRRLRMGGAKLLVVMASPRRDKALEEDIGERADALIWKALGGFDFSAYSVGIDAIRQASPHASLLVMNDSVLGPFGDIESQLSNARWDLTGFTASGRIENHIQSYAFHMASASGRAVDALRPVLSTRYAYDRYVDAIYCQETRLARIAARRLSVGAFWYTAHPLGDPTLYSALPLIEEGYPFLKRKLLTEHRHLHDPDQLTALLRKYDHPLPGKLA